MSQEADHWWYRALRAYCIRRWAKFLQPGAKVLDLGCGSGFLLAKLREMFSVAALGVEPSDLGAKSTHARGIELRQEDMLSFLRNPNLTRYDLILAIDSLYFLSRAEQVQLLDLALHRLNPGGKFALHLPGGRAFRREHDATVGISRRYHRQDVPALLREAQWADRTIIFLRPRVHVLSYFILLRKLWQKLQPAASARSDLQPLPRLVNRAMEAWQRAEDFLPTVPWGSSIYVEIERRS